MEPAFWDIAGPIALLSLLISCVLSIYFIYKKRIEFIFTCGIVTVIISFITFWSIGSYVFGVAIIQVLAAIYLFHKKQRKHL